MKQNPDRESNLRVEWEELRYVCNVEKMEISTLCNPQRLSLESVILSDEILSQIRQKM